MPMYLLLVYLPNGLWRAEILNIGLFGLVWMFLQSAFTSLKTSNSFPLNMAFSFSYPSSELLNGEKNLKPNPLRELNEGLLPYSIEQKSKENTEEDPNEQSEHLHPDRAHTKILNAISCH